MLQTFIIIILIDGTHSVLSKSSSPTFNVSFHGFPGDKSDDRTSHGVEDELASVQPTEHAEGGATDEQAEPSEHTQVHGCLCTRRAVTRPHGVNKRGSLEQLIQNRSIELPQQVRVSLARTLPGGWCICIRRAFFIGT